MSAWDLRRRLRLVEELREAIQPSGWIPKAFEKPVTDAFGPEWWRILVVWSPTNPTLMLMMETFLEKAKLYNLPDADDSATPATPEEEQRLLEMDSALRQQMILKLLDLQKSFLLMALHNAEQRGDAATGVQQRLDLFLRYQSMVKRQFYKALREYRALKNEFSKAPLDTDE